MRDPALAARLAAFSIDEGAPALSFAARLARENRWPVPHAERVVAEYLRFVYLAAISSETVTPSVAIDQAWHLHLCYTRSYWHHLCREVLSRELHHGPTRGGAKENIRYHECYERTLRLYETEFGTPPPADIWPPAARRFAPDANPVSLAPADYFILPKPTLRRAGLLAALIPIAALGLGSRGGQDGGALFVLCFAGFAIIVVISLFFSSRRSSQNRKDRDGGGCSSAGCGSSSKGSDSGCSSGGDSGCGSGCGGGCGGGD